MDLILHAGPPKTGSTSIQVFLRSKENQLKNDGIWPIYLSKMNMAEFSTIFLKSLEGDQNGIRLGINDANFDQYKLKIRTEISELILSAKSNGAKLIIISAESIAALGTGESYEDGALSRLTDFLSSYVSGITLIPVLRRQDLRAMSRYKNIVKNKGWIDQQCFVHTETMHMDKLLFNWSECLGQDSIKPILFPDSVKEQRNLIQDFCNVAGFPHLFDPTEKQLMRNLSVDGRAIEIMRQLNIALPDRHLRKKNKVTHRFNQIAEKYFTDGKQKISPAKHEAKSFLECYAEGNEVVRQTFFKQRDKLFSDEFSMFSDSSRYPEPNLEDLYGILAELLNDRRLLNLLKK